MRHGGIFVFGGFIVARCRLRYGLAVHGQYLVFVLHHVAGNADCAFDVIGFRLQGIIENHHVAALNGAGID